MRVCVFFFVCVCVCVCVCVEVGVGGGLYFLEYELSRLLKLLFWWGVGGGVGWSNTSSESKA